MTEATDVIVEECPLNEGVPLVYAEHRGKVRLAFDPRQIREAAALTLLCVLVPQLVNITVHRHSRRA